MIRGFSVSVLLTVLLLTVYPAEAQQPPKVARIGYLGLSVPSANVARIEAFRQGLRELGYVEGKTLSLSGDGRREKRIGYPILQPIW
jgi:putative tryptophan/tyrosine transport system substrate-binding protein